MGCLIAPAAAALATKVVQKKVPAKLHLEWLFLMLSGGTVMLLVDHVLKGELVIYPPFFTAKSGNLITEVVHVGFPMVIATVVLWALVVTVASLRGKRLSTDTN